MKRIIPSFDLRRSFVAGFFVLIIIGAGLPVRAQKVTNVVIVHGAFADGSGFAAVYNILTGKGYHVTIVQNPCTSLEDDVGATKEALSRQDGPVILVGHSWGGTVITEAGVAPNVAGLVYLEGFLLEAGETTAQLFSFAPPAKEAGMLEPDRYGWIFYPKDKYHMGFAGDLSAEKADFMYMSQVPIAAKCFTTPVTQAAWKDKPAWAVIATGDKSINPVILKHMADRAHATVTEVKSSHVVYISQPEKVAEVIEAAAKGSVK